MVNRADTEGTRTDDAESGDTKLAQPDDSGARERVARALSPHVWRQRARQRRPPGSGRGAGLLQRQRRVLHGRVRRAARARPEDGERAERRAKPAGRVRWTSRAVSRNPGGPGQSAASQRRWPAAEWWRP